MLQSGALAGHDLSFELGVDDLGAEVGAACFGPPGDYRGGHEDGRVGSNDDSDHHGESEVAHRGATEDEENEDGNEGGGRSQDGA